MDRRLLQYYERELHHLRGTAGEFAREFPKIAGRLALDEFACADPYVERLLEGFAFLAARVQLKLDAEFPRFTQGLLETVFPCASDAWTPYAFDVTSDKAYAREALELSFAFGQGPQVFELADLRSRHQ